MFPVQTPNRAIKNVIIRLQQGQRFWLMGQSILVVTVAFQLQPLLEALPVPSGGWFPCGITGLPPSSWKFTVCKEITGIPHGTTMTLINGNYFIVQSICLRTDVSRDMFADCRGKSVLFALPHFLLQYFSHLVAICNGLPFYSSFLTVVCWEEEMALPKVEWL